MTELYAKMLNSLYLLIIFAKNVHASLGSKYSTGKLKNTLLNTFLFYLARLL